MPQKPYRIAFFGTSDFAVPILERLRADGDFSVVEVVTQPDRPSGRKRALTASPVKRAAAALGLAVWQPETLKDEAAFAHLSALGVEAYVVVAYGKILPGRVLEIPPFGGVNVHGSILPFYRGSSPISAAIASGEKETGATNMKMDEKMDEGPTLETVRLAVGDEDTTETLSRKLSALAADTIAPTLKLYLEGNLQPVPQDHSKATYTTILEREDGRIDWKKGAAEIERFARAMQPWPEAFTQWSRKGGPPMRLTLKKAAVMHPTTKCDAGGKPGTVCKLAGGQIGVNCGTGSLELLELQLEGKNPSDAKSFLNGYPDFVGAELR
ncbi:MAG TPA: methionyl-tRNA formyltransferase [Candidatus Baltobacteraceae bacterium]|nr:methionyl-tRNA formyltransferase [Candidatus Baltobacteraceae bacterium]